MSKMPIIDAQVRIKEYTYAYFVDLIQELSKPSVFYEPFGSELPRFIESMAGIEIPVAIYKNYISKKDQQEVIHQGNKEKYQLLKTICNRIIQENLLNPAFFLAKNSSKEKKILDQFCQAHIKIRHNKNLEQLLLELHSAAILIQIITENPNPLSALAQYKEKLRTCHIEMGQSPLRDRFSNKVLSILHPFFNSMQPVFGRFAKPGYHVSDSFTMQSHL